MPKVLRILNRLNIGGPTYNAVYLTQYLAPDFETTLVAGQIDATEGDSSYIAQERGIAPVYVPTMRREISPWADYQAYRFLRKLIRTHRPDIVHTHAAKAGALGRLAALHERVPVVLHTFHGNVLKGYFSPLKTRGFLAIERYLAQRSSAVVAISALQRHELLEEFRLCAPEKLVIVPNGFELDAFQADWQPRRARFRAGLGLPEGTVAIGIVGRLVPIKHHSLFLEAFARLRALTQVPVHAVLIGDGELRAEVEAQARALSLAFDTAAARTPGACLTFTSWITDVASAYPGLDIVALSSRNEGTPVSLIEAQAAGLPVVATDVGGVRDTLLDGSSGTVVPPNDPEAFAQALLPLVESAALRQAYGQAGRDFAFGHYGVVRLAYDMAALYQRLLAAAGR